MSVVAVTPSVGRSVGLSCQRRIIYNNQRHDTQLRITLWIFHWRQTCRCGEKSHTAAPLLVLNVPWHSQNTSGNYCRVDLHAERSNNRMWWPASSHRRVVFTVDILLSKPTHSAMLLTETDRQRHGETDTHTHTHTHTSNETLFVEAMHVCMFPLIVFSACLCLCLCLSLAFLFLWAAATERV